MNLRALLLLAGLVTGVLQGQATTPAQGATPGNANSSRPGASPTRANGVPPTGSGQRGSRTGSQPGGNSLPGNNGNGRSGNNQKAAASNQPPAPAATGKIEVIGRTTGIQPGSMDHPLLPIGSLGNGLGVVSGTPIRVTLRQAVDSGHAHNGDMLDGTLAAPLAGLRVGTPVRLTVVSASRAGQLTSYGELSLQVVSIADRQVLSDTITAQGKEGPKELPDAAPARGTEAIFTPDQVIDLPAA